MQPELVLLCKDCKRPIPLPNAAVPESTEITTWPRGAAHVPLICTYFGHTYEYSSTDFEPSAAPVHARSKPRCVAMIEVPCGSGGCSGTIKIRTVVDFDSDVCQMAPALLENTTLHDIQCGKGHFISGRSQGLSSYDASFDENWETT